MTTQEYPEGIADALNKIFSIVNGTMSPVKLDEDETWGLLLTFYKEKIKRSSLKYIPVERIDSKNVITKSVEVSPSIIPQLKAEQKKLWAIHKDLSITDAELIGHIVDVTSTLGSEFVGWLDVLRFSLLKEKK